MYISSKRASPIARGLCLLALILPSCLPQAPPPPSNQKPDYSQEPYVVEESSSEITFENDGTDTRNFKVRVHIQSDSGVQHYAVLTLAYQSSSQSIDIDYVRVRKPDGTVVLTPPDNVQDLDSEITRQAPFYSDSREKHVAVRGLGVGDVLEYQAHWKTTKPLVPGQFWLNYDFSHDGIILEDSLQVSVPRERPVKWRSPKSKPAISETPTRRLFTWSNSQVDHKSKEQEKKDQETLVSQAGRGRVPQPEIQLSSFQTWEEVGRWYYNLQEERVKPTPEIQAKAAELTKGLADDLTKTRAIYTYVSSQVHYIGIGFGIGRYQPHFAGDVLGNQYGDCKDKHTLLAALLKAVGIQAFPVLIGSSHELDPDLPSPGQFDHLITAVQLGDQLTWLDSTPEVGPFAYLVSVLRGKKALLAAGDKPPALITTPPDPPTRAVQTFRIVGKLSDSGILQAKIERTLQGDDGEVLIRTVFRRMPVPQWTNLVQQLSYQISFAGEVSEVTASSPEKTDEPFRFGYDYVRKEFPDWPNRRLTSPLPPVTLPGLPEKDEKPLHPVWLGPKGEVRYESHIELPKGYTPTLPKNLDLTESFAEYHRSYGFKSNILTTQRRIIAKLSEVPAAEYEAYKKFGKAVTDDYEFMVPLSSGPAPALSAYQNEIWELPLSKNADAVRAYDDAREKFNRSDIIGEIVSLKRAVDLDPKFTRAWLWLGDLYKFNRQSDDAIQAYRKAISIDPLQAVSYKALGYSLLAMQKPEDAIAVWRQFMHALPDETAGPAGLGLSFFRLRRYAEAQTALEAAAKLSPDSSEVQMLLGNACLRAANREKAIAAYQKAIELAPSRLMYNNIAYQLAEQSESLTLALEYAKKAVAEEAGASHALKLSELRLEDLEPARRLAMYWDTLGWVYFRMGDLTQAEKYVNSAWMLTQSAVMADHLGQVFERGDKKQAAIRMYEFALHLAPLRVSGGAELAEATRERIERLAPGKSATDFANNMEITNEVNRMRTLTITLDTMGDASANFFLVLAQDPKTSAVIVEDVKFIDGSEKLKSATTALKATDFKLPLPADGQPRVLRRGILFCSTRAGCSFTLINPNDVRSVK